jgi:hypothetical protein
MAKNPGDEPGTVGMHACYSGPKSRADQVLAPIRKAAKPLEDGIKAVDYVAIQKSWDWTDPRTVGSYLKSGFVTGISPEVIDRLLDGFEPDPSRRTSIFFQQSGGAIGRVSPDATAFAHRHATHNMFCTVSWDPAQDPGGHIDYIRRWWATLEPSTNGWYTNEISNESFAKVRANYQGNFERLVQVKGRYDPTNLFRLNANVPPSA